MKHAISAVVALAMGFGVAAAAQAEGYNQSAAAPTNMQATAPASDTQTAAPMQRQHRSQHARLSRRNIEQMQRHLRAAGLYRGRIDGIVGPQTREAMARMQQHTARLGGRGQPHTARLGHATRNRMMGGQAVGVGSSAPTQPQGTQDSLNGNTAPVTPPTTPNAAGSNTNQQPSPPNQPQPQGANKY
jgi:peptidoglycan hydrolase-like protein with peptidoglycan-binding domain